MRAEQAAKEYGFRFDCEEEFRDLKWDLGFSESRVKQIAAWSRLFALFAIAGYGTTEFDMIDERIAALVETGRAAMAPYLDTTVGLVPPSKGGAPAGRAGADDGGQHCYKPAQVMTGQLWGDPNMIENFRAHEESAESPRGEKLRMPGESDLPKLPMPLPAPTLPPGLSGQRSLPNELKEAWTQYMVNGFKQNEEMFKSTLEAFMKPYRMTVRLYVALFGVGVGLFLAAAVIGLRNGSSVVAIAFAGMSVGAFLTFFVRQPLHALEENLEFITWLGVAFNTYWTRLMYMSDPMTVQAELKAADDDFRTSVERLIAQHAKLRVKRHGAAKDN